MPTRYPPIDLEISSQLLPNLDLNIQGDPKRNLRIPQDVIIALAGIIGIQSNKLPRMAQMSPTGALYVTEATGGLNDFVGGDFNAASNVVVGIDLGQICNPIYLRADGASFIIQPIPIIGGTRPSFTLAAGFQVLLPYSVKHFTVLQTSGVNQNITVLGFINNPNPNTG